MCYCYSCADSCKGTVTSGNLTNGCNHYPIHLTDDAVRNDIISRFGNGTNRLSRIIWSGHLLNGNPSSNSSDYSHTVVMTIRHTTSFV